MAADLVGVLGQAAPAAATDTAAYTVPASRVAVLSTLAVCNTGAATTYRVHIRKAGAAVAVGNAVAYEVSLGAGQTDPLTWGITLGPGDIVSVRSASGAVTFTVFGEETDVPA